MVSRCSFRKLWYLHAAVTPSDTLPSGSQFCSEKQIELRVQSSSLTFLRSGNTSFLLKKPSIFSYLSISPDQSGIILLPREDRFELIIRSPNGAVSSKIYCNIKKIRRVIFESDLFVTEWFTVVKNVESGGILIPEGCELWIHEKVSNVKNYYICMGVHPGRFNSKSQNSGEWMGGAIRLLTYQFLVFSDKRPGIWNGKNFPEKLSGIQESGTPDEISGGPCLPPSKPLPYILRNLTVIWTIFKRFHSFGIKYFVLIKWGVSQY